MAIVELVKGIVAVIPIIEQLVGNKLGLDVMRCPQRKVPIVGQEQVVVKPAEYLEESATDEEIAGRNGETRGQQRETRGWAKRCEPDGIGIPRQIGCGILILWGGE